MTWLLAIAVVGGVAAVVVSFVAVHTALQAKRQYDLLLENVPKAAHLADLEQRIADRRTEVEKLSGQVAEHERLREKIPGLERLVADLEMKKATLQPIEEQHARLGEQVAQRQAELQQIQQEIEKVRWELKEDRERLEKLQRQADAERLAAVAAKAELEESRRQHRGLQESITDARGVLADLEVRCDEAREAVRSVQNELDLTQAKLREVKAERSSIESEIAPLREAKAALLRDLKELEQQQQQQRERKRQLEEQIAGLLAQQARLQAEIQELELKRAKVQEDMQHLLDGYMAQGKAVTGAFEFVDAFDSIRTPVLMESKVRRPDMREEDALDAVKEHASSLGFLYPDRVLRSFHTSLKLGGNSPLLVLAGISGTGKSQLPRLYCDAVGIHFLPMAVQPAWDSPADMLGFFSHIERRFKPTPMARALFQMDKWTLEELKRLTDTKKRKEFLNGIQPHHDEMLLVLLDEMNLARIEYYFSDFLSRLEQRNAAGFDEGDPKSRARAQVLLEAPNALGGMEDLPLLVGSNVLLVGTMNEDESTMSLSDKVLDRANVLRFGRPNRLQSATKSGTGKPASDYLNRKNWLQWCATSKASSERSKEVDQIKEWTDRLNDCLHKSNRAFAHRTAGAIQAYCLAYPRLQTKKGDNTMDTLRMAFADQIEQRVMPKLRGLDCGSPSGTETIESLLELVADLNDDVLRKALDEGREANDGHSFVWSGVSREH
jgi:hypothetical protein